MASLRMYRDYVLDEDTASTTPKRTPSLQKTATARSTTSNPRKLSPRSAAPRAASPRINVIPDLLQDFDDANSLNGHASSIAQTLHGEDEGNIVGEHEIGIARTSDNNGRVDSARHLDNSIAEATDEDNTDVATDEDDDVVVEPVLDEGHLRSLDSAAPAFSYSTRPQDPKGGLAPSVLSISAMSDASGSSRPPRERERERQIGKSTLPEFFNRATFQIVLTHPTIAHQLLEFGQSRLCGENLDFLNRVTKYNALLGEVAKSIYEVHKEFVVASAPSQINLSEALLKKTNENMKAALTSTLPSLENVFAEAQGDIEKLVYTDIYPNFVRHQMSVSAAKALGGDRTKYAGLGDCFVLTDPSKADNPILYASDGFVKVTGYQRNEIIPRNCRFLQNRHTDRASVRRIKSAIDKRQETVELLLNEKKSGEPFWNLLYVCPLYDAHGKLAFFLGGQINCSTTIHNASDVLRILGASKDVAEPTVPGMASPPPPVKAPRTRGILNAFRSNNRSSVQPRAPGMENTLLDRIGDMPLESQIDSFYTAYSNYVIVNYSSFLISFVSAGLIDLLFPIKAKTAYHAQAVGSDVFKFLANHSSGSLSWDFKSTVKGALKMGQAASLELKLCAKPYMGFETFITHWTPLKDEVGAVVWVVLTFGNERRA